MSEPRGGQRLTRDERLRNRTDYLRCYRKGRRQSGSLLNIHSIANQEGHPRLGITASRKVGPAVVRQRVKRRVREIFRRWSHRNQLPALDLVVHLHPAVAKAPFRELEAELTRRLSRLLPGAATRSSSAL